MSILNKSLNVRNSAAAALMVLLAIAIVSTVAVMMMRNSAHQDAISLARETASSAASTVAEKLEIASGTARTNAVTMRTLRETGVTGRDIHNALLEQSLIATPSLVGVAVVWEPNALDGRDADYRNAPAHDSSGRFVPYWYRSEGQIQVEVLAEYDTPGTGDYYVLVRDTGQEVVLEPYVYPVGGVDTVMTTMSAPIEINGQVRGGAMADIALGDLQTALSQIRPMQTGRVTLISNGGALVAGQDANLLGQPASQAGFGANVLNATSSSQPVIIESDTNPDGESLIRVVVPFEVGQTGTNWLIVTDIPRSAALANVNAITRNVVILSIVIGLIAAIAAFLFSGLMTKPVVALTHVMQRLVQDDLDVDVPYTHHQDEIGQMAKATSVFLEHARARRDHEAQQKEADAEKRAREERRRAMNALADEFQATISDVAGSVAQAAQSMQSSAQDLSRLASESGETASGASGSADHAQNSVQSVASAAEEMSAAIAEMTRQVSRSSEVADSGAEMAETADGRIQGLATAADEIGTVVNLINDIAEQTNLLALNATIEAARAGEAGKGFAVVASEVKALAEQTAKATEQISNQINTIQGETSYAVDAIRQVRAKIDEINEATNMIAASAEEQTAATAEIAGSAQSAATSATEVNTAVMAVSSSAQQTGDMAGEVLQSADSLNVQATRLQDSVAGFIERVRSA